MRTTVDLDDDVLLAVQERARREKRSAGKVLSGLARQAMAGRNELSMSDSRGRHGFRPLPSRGPIVSNALIDRLREDEAE